MPPPLLPDLSALKVDALLVSALVNVRYLSGFTGSNALLLLTGTGARLYTDPRYEIQAPQESRWPVKIVKGPLFKAVLGDLRRRRTRRLGIESTRITFGLYSLLRPHIRLEAIGPVIEEMRMIKSGDEVERIRRSVRVNSYAFDRALKRFRVSMTESDLAAELEYQMRRQGAEKPAFETIVAAGPKSALPHAQPGRERAGGRSQLLLIDMGAQLEGYSSDMTRTLHIGNPAARARRLYKAVLEAQLAAIEAVRENAAASAVDRAARSVLKAHGMDRLFVHSTGHGLGLEIHEPPRIGRNEKTRLKAGMVITIEPGAYVKGFGGVRIEDTVLVKEKGCEILTPTPKEFLVL
ncbi:MAG TPA: Xaa-Pro peptidase family protein [Bryobacteraceae bacterium]|nr:Xaa-Pro peptidase family protein [Bryobacteraceae bacterium]